MALTLILADVILQTMKKPDADLQKLAEKLIGTWRFSGEATGKVRYSWLKKGVFLKQDFDIKIFGRRVKGTEIIGRLRPPNKTPSREIWSRAYIFSEGQTFDYVYELRARTITIWFGGHGSANRFKGKFATNGDTYEGAWRWPGGGYKIKATKV